MQNTTIAAKNALESGAFAPFQIAHLREIIRAEMEDTKLPQQEFYTVHQVAKRLGKNVQTVRKYCREGIIKARMRRQAYLIHREELARYEKSLKP